MSQVPLIAAVDTTSKFLENRGEELGLIFFLSHLIFCHTLDWHL